MAFNSQSDFKGDVNITQSSEVTEDLNQVIIDVEIEILSKLLGDDLYLLLIADLDGNYAPQTQKYKDLVNGKEYKRAGYTVNYQGIKRMLRYFVYSEWLKTGRISNVSGGTVIETKDKSESLSRFEIRAEANRAYNKGMTLYLKAYDFLYNNSVDYPTWEYKDIYAKGFIETHTQSNGNDNYSRYHR